MPDATTPSTDRYHGRFGSIWRYVLALTISATLWAITAAGLEGRTDVGDAMRFWFVAADPALGLLTYVLVHFRHRWPGSVGVATGLISIVSTTAAAPASWMVGSLTSHHRWRLLSFVIPVNIAAGVIQERIYPSNSTLPLWASVLFGLLVMGIIVSVGYAMGSQRDLLESLRDRAETAEREQQARVAQGQASERTRIAREMHDVLAHRISLVAMHAGALSYRTDLSPEEQAVAAKTIETNAHQALRDLRDVLGVLRDPTLPADTEPERPQPVMSDISRLVEDERASGMRVSLDDAVQGELPDNQGRTAYRVVQEALTNARKHASGTSVTVTLVGGPEDGLTVTVRNAAPVGTRRQSWPASGLGLVGLVERVGLAGGRLTHGPDATGGYVVDAWIPWSV